jgi:hypothetical protein
VLLRHSQENLRSSCTKATGTKEVVTVATRPNTRRNVAENTFKIEGLHEKFHQIKLNIVLTKSFLPALTRYPVRLRRARQAEGVFDPKDATKLAKYRLAQFRPELLLQEEKRLRQKEKLQNKSYRHKLHKIMI